MRALAALAVLAGHVWIFARPPQLWIDTYAHRVIYGGGFGVFVFFGLSGYLLFWPFARHHFGTGERIDLRSYARNRFLRIVPLYWIAVVVLQILQNDGGRGADWWRHLLFVQSMWRDSLNAVDGPLWSVAVEIQFYVLLPLLAWGLARAARGHRLGAAALIAALGVLSGVLRHTIATHNGDLWGYQLPCTFVFFTGGMLVALLRLQWEERAPRWLEGPLGSSTLWIVVSVPLWAIVIDDFRYQELIVPATFLLIGAIVLPVRRGPLVAALEWRPLALLGVASYSLYVWHVPIVDALQRDGFLHLAVVAVPASVAAAFASYHLIEAPALRLRRRWASSAAPQLGSAS